MASRAGVMAGATFVTDLVAKLMCGPVICNGSGGGIDGGRVICESPSVRIHDLQAI